MTVTDARMTRKPFGVPVVYCIVNNQYGMGTSVEQSSAEPDLWRRAAAYRMHGERIDGNDVLAVREATDLAFVAPAFRHLAGPERAGA